MTTGFEVPHSHSSPAGVRRIGLVGCVKTKADRPRQAKDLYRSSLFSGRRAYVERHCDEWWILSAGHGLVHPDTVLSPDDVCMADLDSLARRRWSASMIGSIRAQLRPAPGTIFELHAGSMFRDFGLVDGLDAIACEVAIPTAHLGIGRQLHFYRAAVSR